MAWSIGSMFRKPVKPVDRSKDRGYRGVQTTPVPDDIAALQRRNQVLRDTFKKRK